MREGYKEGSTAEAIYYGGREEAVLGNGEDLRNFSLLLYIF